MIWFADMLIISTVLAAGVTAYLHLARSASPRVRHSIVVVAAIASVVLPLLALEPAASEAPFVTAREWTAPQTPRPWLPIAWIGIGATLLARELLLHWRMRRALIRWQLEPHLGHAVVASDVAGPLTAGLLRPIVVIPHELADELTSEELRRVIAHEEEHARWRDPLVHALLRTAARVLWPNVALWYFCHLAAREREAAADRAAAGQGGTAAAASYAQMLVDLSRVRTPLAQFLSGHSLPDRVSRLLTPPSSSPARFAAPLALIAAFAIIPSLVFIPLVQRQIPPLRRAILQSPVLPTPKPPPDDQVAREISAQLNEQLTREISAQLERDLARK